MKYTTRDVSALFDNSRHLNEKKKEIILFDSMFVRSLHGKAITGFACTRLINDLQSEKHPNLLLRIFRDHRHERLKISVIQNEKELCTLVNAQSLPRHLIIPVWRMLPKLLEWLEETFPEVIKPEIELYRTAGSSPTGMF